MARRRTVEISKVLGAPLHRVGSDGFSTAAVVVVLMVAAVGILSLVNRSSSGRTGAAYKTQTITAREVARSGMLRIIGELNKPANRGMLVSGVPLNGWSASPNPAIQNPCLRPPFTGSATPTTAAARGFGANATQSFVAGDTTRRFVLRSIRYASADRSHWIRSEYNGAGIHSSSSANDFLANRSNILTATNGLLELVVEGQVYNSDGTLVSRAKLAQEFVVAPKCCDRSFNGTTNAFGNGANDVKGTDATQCAMGAGASGSLITETLGNATGELDTQDMHLYGLVSGTPQLLTEFKCLTTAASCRGTDPPAPGRAAAANGFVTASLLSSLPLPPIHPDPLTPSYEFNSGDDTYYRINAANTGIEVCEVSGTNTLINCAPAPYCIKLVNSVADYHCKMQRMRLSAMMLYVDTTLGTIAFYLNNGVGEIKFSGTSGLLHRKCASFPGATTMCTTAAQLGDFPRLAFYSNLLNANFEFTGTSSSLVAFLYNRRGRIHQSGGSSLYGAVWGNVVSGSGNSNIYVPTNLASVSTTQGYCSLVPGGCGVTAFDWVARSVSNKRMF